MAIISNEWYQQRERERQQAAAALAKVEVPAQALAFVNSTDLSLAASPTAPLAGSTSSPEVDSTSSAKPPVVSLSKPQAATSTRVSGLSKVELPARAPVTNSELEPGEVADEQRTVEVALSRVSEPQAAALRALVEGRTTVQAAAEARVDRGTLYRWRTRDREFMAALNAWRADMVAQARDRMLALADKAVAAVAGGLDKGDARLGLRVLKDLECSRVGTTQPRDPEDIKLPGDLPEDASPEHRALVAVMQTMTAGQSKRMTEILQVGIAADNARAAAERDKPVEPARGERIESACPEPACPEAPRRVEGACPEPVEGAGPI